MTDDYSEAFQFRTLLAEIGVGRFFERYWQKHSGSLPLLKKDFEKILREVGPLDIRRFCESARGGARAWLSNDFVAHSVIPVDSSNAERFFGIGATLYFLNIPLGRLTNALADFLGAPRKKIIASIFVTPAGGGAVPHFDKNENFTIQLSGTKEWIVDDIPAVTAPTDGYVLGHTVPVSLRQSLPLPKDRNSQSILMQPGKLLYVPRGAVHRTVAGAMSWSLNLSYIPSTWLDLILVGLKRDLSLSDQWRGTVTGVGQACDPCALAANILPNLVLELQKSLSDREEIQRLAEKFFENPDG